MYRIRDPPALSVSQLTASSNASNTQSTTPAWHNKSLYGFPLSATIFSKSKTYARSSSGVGKSTDNVAITATTTPLSKNASKKHRSLNCKKLANKRMGARNRWRFRVNPILKQPITLLKNKCPWWPNNFWMPLVAWSLMYVMTSKNNFVLAFHDLHQH